MDFNLPADHREKLKVSEKRYKYQDPPRELKSLWNMKVTVRPVVIGALATATKGLVQGAEVYEIRGRVETIQTTAWLRLARIVKRVLKT